MTGDREDPLIPDGPTEMELRDASMSLMLAPLREQLDAIQAAALAEIESGLAIVRALTAADPLRRTTLGQGFEGEECRYCDAIFGWSPETAGHKPTCPWRLAREWVAEHPEASDGH